MAARRALAAAVLLALAACGDDSTEPPPASTADVTITVRYADTFAPASTAPVAVVAIHPTSPPLHQEVPVVGGSAVLTFRGVRVTEPFYQIVARVLSTTGGAERGQSIHNCVAITPPAASFTLEVPDGDLLETDRNCAARR